MLLRPAPPGSSYRRWSPSCPFGPAALPPAGGLPPALSARSLFPAAPQIRSPLSVSAWSPSSAGFPGARAFRHSLHPSQISAPIISHIFGFCNRFWAAAPPRLAPFPPEGPPGGGPHGRPPLGSPRADPPFYCGQPSAAAGRPASSTVSTSRMPAIGSCPFCSFTVR